MVHAFSLFNMLQLKYNTIQKLGSSPVELQTTLIDQNSTKYLALQNKKNATNTIKQEGEAAKDRIKES